MDFAWIFFRANSFTDARTIIKNMFYFNPWIFTTGSIYKLGLDRKDFVVAILCIIVVLIVDLMKIHGSIKDKLYEKNTLFRWAVYITAIMAILIFGEYGPGYSAQEFIYLQF